MVRVGSDDEKIGRACVQFESSVSEAMRGDETGSESSLDWLH